MKRVDLISVPAGAFDLPSRKIDELDYRACIDSTLAGERAVDATRPEIGEAAAVLVADFAGTRPAAFYEGYFAALHGLLVAHLAGGLTVPEIALLAQAAAHVHARAARKERPE